jgi:hypothetical protein
MAGTEQGRRIFALIKRIWGALAAPKIFALGCLNLHCTRKTDILCGKNTVLQILLRLKVSVFREIRSKIYIFWDITPCTRVKIKWSLGGTFCFHLQGRITSQKVTSKKEVASNASCWVVVWLRPCKWRCSSKTSFDLQWSTRHYIPEDKTPHIHRCENLKSCILR